MSACDPGYYSLGNTGNCTRCPAGYACPSTSQAPQLCSRGTYSLFESTSCSDCNPGYHCSPGSTSPTPEDDLCPIGGWCDPPSTFHACPAGTFGNVTGGSSQAESCVVCPAGHYCPQGSTPTSYFVCKPGYYCPNGTTASNDFPCPAGTYNSNPGAMLLAECLNCPAGSHCPQASVDDRLQCPSGSYCPEAVTSPLQCDPGTFSGPVVGLKTSSQCFNCTAGNYCPAGSVDPRPCSPGTYNNRPRAHSQNDCWPCPAGFACPNYGTTLEKAVPCAQGHWCDAGTVNPDDNPCNPGFYSNRTDLVTFSECIECPPGYACPGGNGWDSNPPQQCSPGHFCELQSSSVTEDPCPAGTYSPKYGLRASSECIICPAGAFCFAASVQITGGCPTGHYCPRGTTYGQEFPCPAGTYNDVENATHILQCKDCPKGHYCGQGASRPETCPQGTYRAVNNTESIDQCTTCPAGYECPTTAMIEPEPCFPGRHSVEGSTECDVCEIGHYCDENTTSTSAMYGDKRCPAGLYCVAGLDKMPEFTNEACPLGSYCPEATLAPIACGPGYYQPFEGRGNVSDCLLCPAGSYCVGGEPNITGLCAPGHYCPAGSSVSDAVRCPAKFYRKESGGQNSQSCAVCPAGHYCLEATSTPTKCPRGYYCITGIDDPEPCPLGTYGNSTGLRRVEECTPCQPGHYCDGQGLTEPREECDPGYYCLEGSYTSAPQDPSDFESDRPIPIGGRCPAGGYCPRGSSKAAFCPSGTFNNATGAESADDCIPCPPGFFCQGSSNPFPTGPCKAGYYCTGGASVETQFTTQPGYYTLAGAVTPAACPPGSYNPNNAASSCEPCDEGRYCPDFAMTEPLICPPGGYCPLGSDQPEACPAGTYSQEDGQHEFSTCTPCTPGQYCAYDNLTQPTGPCALGYFCVNGSSVANPTGLGGDICPLGHYCPEGTFLPEECPIGTFYNNTGAGAEADCLPCDPGMYCNNDGLAYPVGECAAGYYCTLGSAYDQPDDSSGVGGICPEGYYCPEGSSSPRKCDQGYFMNNTGAAECYTCPAGHYCDGGDTTTFKNCPRGSYCPEGSFEPEPCPAGTYGTDEELVSADECTPCARGFYCPSRGQTTYTLQCDAGFLCLEGCDSPDGGQPNGVDLLYCPAGNYCPQGTTHEVPCPPGTYRPEDGAAAVEDCYPCSQGEYCGTSGLTEPTGNCSAGYYCHHNNSIPTPETGVELVSFQYFSGSRGGDVCPAGYFCPPGTHDPQACPGGTYNTEVGGGYEADACAVCSPGRYCPEASTSDGLPCPEGYYCPAGTSDTTWQPCPPGTFSNQTGYNSENDCILCPPGKYCEGEHNTKPTGDCAVGFYCILGASTSMPNDNTTGAPCVAGEYCAEGSWQPEYCTPGFYCELGDPEPTGACDAGYYCTQGSFTPTPTGQINSAGPIGDRCPEGHWCPAQSSTPMPCPEGTFSNTTGNGAEADCLPCTPGFYCPSEGTVVPEYLCTSGYYCPEGSIAPSDPCTAGDYCPTGSAAPLPCPNGTYQSSTQQDFCNPCETGFYCPIGTDIPIICPPGSYCPIGTSFDKEFLCPPGTFSANEGLESESECEPCPPGTYCGEYGLTVNSGNCSAGHYCLGGSSVPTPTEGFDNGYACSIAATTSHLPGYGDLRFLLRFPGNYSLDGYAFSTLNLTEAPPTIGDICPPGHFCPEGSEAPIPCPAGTVLPSYGATSRAECDSCPPQYYCDVKGLAEAVDLCLPGYYCPGGDITPTEICPTGYFCPEGSDSPQPCPAGEYQPQEGLAECEVCPPGYYCEEATTTPAICPAGSYCLEGTERANQFLCSAATFSNKTGRVSQDECFACTPGMYCASAGLTAPTDFCDPGYYCVENSTVSNPSTLPVGDVCPQGHFCPLGSSAPLSCPVGTFLPTTGSSSQADCIACSAGYYCNSTGLEMPEALCIAGFYCPEGTQDPNLLCPLGHFCPTGSATPQPCSAGAYQSSMQSPSCDPCPAGFYCPEQTSDPIDCPAGYYCPLSTANATDFPCPVGTFSNDAGLEIAAECTPCIAGSFCEEEGITEPSGLCGPGYYCTRQAVEPQPMDASTGGPCAPGFVCLFGATGPRPNDETGYPCPAGSYCEEGSVVEFGCPSGTYNPTEGQEECTPCPVSHYCPANSTNPIICPLRHYCDGGLGVPKRCPPGFVGEETGLASASECEPCPPGKFCVDGTVAGDCDGGYLCHIGNADAQPEASARPRGEPCPAGYFCPAGALEAIPCPNGTFSGLTHQESSSVCGACPPGFTCDSGNPTPTPCRAGYYCPGGGESYPCMMTTYNNNTGAEDASACLPCPAGYLCLGTGLVSFFQYPCPEGYFCPESADEAIPCPGGTFMDTPGAGSSEECIECPGGSFCGAASVVPDTCPSATYCPAGTAVPQECPAGFFCRANSDEPEQCPAGSYCPSGSAPFGIGCPFGSYCPAGSAYPTNCPKGSVGRIGGNRVSLAEACELCEPGYYSDGTNGTSCELCEPGYVCLGNTSAQFPTSAAQDKGYACPPGHYCPLGSDSEIPCPMGTYNQFSRRWNASQCLLCPVDTYGAKKGQAQCKPCGTSATTALNGSTTCTCLGAYRSFQSDGNCLCIPGYEAFDEFGVRLPEDQDGAEDCQPIERDRCEAGQVRDANGVCQTDGTVACSTVSCPDNAAATLNANGLCECPNELDLSQICDTECLNSASTASIDCITEVVTITFGDGSSEEFLLSDVPGLFGEVDCASIVSEEDLETSPGEEAPTLTSQIVTLNFGANGFEGVYGVGGSLGSAGSGTQNRRLTTSSHSALDLLDDEFFGDEWQRRPRVLQTNGSTAAVVQRPLVCLQLGRPSHIRAGFLHWLLPGVSEGQHAQ